MSWQLVQPRVWNLALTCSLLSSARGVVVAADARCCEPWRVTLPRGDWGAAPLPVSHSPPVGMLRCAQPLLASAMRVAQQAIQVAVSLLVLRHQHQRILQNQRYIVIALKMYFSAVIQPETAVLILLPQVFEFTVTTRQAIGAIEVINTQ